jgi:hypothetical protein
MREPDIRSHRKAEVAVKGRRRRAVLVKALLSAGVAAVAVLVVLVAFGALDSGTPRFRPEHVGHKSYAWLVPTTGSQPSIATENQAAGTRAWRLPGPSKDVGGLAQGHVEGYVARQAVRPGQTERIYVSAPGARFVRIRIFRIGWYGGAGGREVLASTRLPVTPQPPCTHRSKTGLTECDWHPTLSFQVPQALPSGVYIGKLSASRGMRDVLFVVTATHPQPLLAQLPTATYEAYNAWGGDSLYPGGPDPVGITGTKQGVEVSFDRPYDGPTGAGEFFQRDVAMVWFLEHYGYPVSYTTSESVDQDPGQLRGHRALLDFGHSEYWSERQRRGFAKALASGTSLLFFSSDTLAWRVRYAPATWASSEAGQPDHVLIGYKEHAALDPKKMPPIFPHRGASLTGSAYLGCITPRLQQRGLPTYRYYAWAPSPNLKPRWLFSGTGITPNTRIPGIVGYELDQQTPYTPRGAKLIGEGSARCVFVTPQPYAPVWHPGDDLSQTTLYTAPSGATVFSSGTLGWELGLAPVPSASPDAPRKPDERVVAMTRNLLAHVLATRSLIRPG